MKCSLFVAILACVLSASLASSKYHPKVEKAHSEVMSYVAENMGGVRMMRSNKVHLECYNGFLPLINSLAVKAKEVSNICVKDAEEQKNKALDGLDRTNVEDEVKKITDSLADCSTLTGMDYFVCLAGNAEKNIQILQTIKQQAQSVISDNSALVSQIDANEMVCLNNAVDNAKNESDKAFSKLKSCINGQASFEVEEQSASQ